MKKINMSIAGLKSRFPIPGSRGKAKRGEGGERQTKKGQR